ncbi:hypothetical protein FHW64_001266 [Variovorax sp. Sphag1AA]|nr:hypothetical protein [Variovorax sp. Sphag1AA]
MLLMDFFDPLISKNVNVSVIAHKRRSACNAKVFEFGCNDQTIAKPDPSKDANEIDIDELPCSGAMDPLVCNRGSQRGSRRTSAGGGRVRARESMGRNFPARRPFSGH